MKRVIDINIGGINFATDEDAYVMLKSYLTRFEATIGDPGDVKEVMEDIEYRIAEIFQREIKTYNQVVDEKMVRNVIELLGDVEDPYSDKRETAYETDPSFIHEITKKRLYRDVDNKRIAGVCSGISAYFNIDVTLVRVLFLVGLLGYSATFWVYIVLWIAAPKALTISQKLKMRGIPVTAENIKKYSSSYYKR